MVGGGRGGGTDGSRCKAAGGGGGGCEGGGGGGGASGRAPAGPSSLTSDRLAALPLMLLLLFPESMNDGAIPGPSSAGS